ncbi:GNAT family N-acetyltransferase [Simiduia sp. 21SJ11W-1]|uniref:GNAT family N-acetyltransferase n=1 Tax=Simiduia sp. 21SJ11W-1 TaxID=2909669 RepID=UPI00209DD17F|nr:GNAT family N-acetyltransferase [Simiduia sp. 21SJ11W-1]UTA49052.1 GNAT family N-acetyltransferase [Simiduia sp. 21SJ11W-1]
MIKLATSDADIQACYSVMRQLRPQLIAERFVSCIRQMQAEGFQLAMAQAEGAVVAVAGFRVSTNLHLGKNLYVDDLVTDSRVRSQGYGEELVAWLEAFGKVQGCVALHLDSGAQRDQAHKFYFAQGFTITSFHFVKSLVA